MATKIPKGAPLVENPVVDKEKFKDSGGKYITQGLFIDFKYSDKFAVYCLASEDKEYDGVLYPSLKRLYLEMEDVTEYEFASTHLAGWDHWQKICGNAVLRIDIDKWRDELELKMKAIAAKAMVKAAREGDLTAAKWLSVNGWQGARGRPSKAELKAEQKRRDAAAKDTEKDAANIMHLLKKD